MATCESTHLSPTATGDVEVHCTKTAGHAGQHEGRVGVFSVRWNEPAHGDQVRSDG